KDDYYLLAFWPGWCVINGYIFSFWTQKLKNKITYTFFILSLIFSSIVIFTPIKFDKIRNPEFKTLAEYVKKTVPEDKKIITYNLFYYDMVALIPWYWSRGVIHSSYPNPNLPQDAKAWKMQSVNTEEELLFLLSLDVQYVLIKKTDYEKLKKEIQQKLKILISEGKYYFCSNNPNL
ncbi:MAG: hypothetical protein ACK4WJ_05805, partial [Endomicrobiia bacterium]